MTDKGRILLVDDDLAVRKVYAAGLVAVGFSVECKSNGKGVAEILGKGSVDLMIMDIVMDDCDGFEVLSDMRRNGQEVPTIAISGTKQYLEIGALLGCRHTLLKPFTIPQLMTLVDDVVVT